MAAQDAASPACTARWTDPGARNGEHGIVVKGTAEVTCADQTILLTENQSTFIPISEMHRLANPGLIALEIIEVQSGSCLDEGDIVRFEDRFGRAGP